SRRIERTSGEKRERRGQLTQCAIVATRRPGDWNVDNTARIPSSRITLPSYTRSGRIRFPLEPEWQRGRETDGQVRRRTGRSPMSAWFACASRTTTDQRVQRPV